MSNLNNAIQLIREGRKDEARRILEPLLQAEPTNISAWFWYVDTCPTLEKRIQTLELCLKRNPGNSQVTQALLTLRSQMPPQISSAPPPVQTPKPAATYYDPAPYSAAYEEEPQKSSASSKSNFDYDYGTPYASSAAESVKQQTPAKKKNANALYRSSSLIFIAVLALAMALLYPIISIIGLSIGAGIQNLLAVLWGGNGYYSRTLYAWRHTWRRS
ncbi:MAG: hypothetical protein IPL71_20990 [Anaerolineales bacterium]|uniref:hypothetical protein n=1 Tax=Candidatus Villigracilis proximus TaxID=3140683 RepID=UPI0031350CAC|nr:hypothetical protein [Anaerolineales bacterium]